MSRSSCYVAHVVFVGGSVAPELAVNSAADLTSKTGKASGNKGTVWNSAGSVVRAIPL